MRREENQAWGEGARRTKCCWEVKKAKDRGLATGFVCLWVLVTLIRAVSVARKGQYPTGIGGEDVMCTRIHSFIKRLLQRAGGQVELEVGSVFQVFSC